MRNAPCYTIVTGPAPGTGEWDGYACAHCSKQRFVKPMCSAGDMPDQCHLCSSRDRPAFICEECRGKGCTPFLKKIEAEEHKAYITAQWV